MTAYLPNIYEMLTIICMGSVTYFTRIIGFLWLRNHQLSSRLKAVLEASPCCVMVSVVAPSFATTEPRMILALLFTILIAFKVNLATTICASVIFMAILQQLMP